MFLGHHQRGRPSALARLTLKSTGSPTERGDRAHENAITPGRNGAEGLETTWPRHCTFPPARSASGVRRDKAALSSGCKAHPATAPAGSNRSRHGGDEMSEAFG